MSRLFPLISSARPTMSTCEFFRPIPVSDSGVLTDQFKHLTIYDTNPEITSKLPYLPNEIHYKIIQYLSLEDLFAYRSVSTLYYKLCLSEIYQRYVNRSFAVLGAYVCHLRFLQPQMHDLWRSYQWNPSVDVNEQTITWSGEAEFPSVPVEGLFLCIFFAWVSVQIHIRLLPSMLPKRLSDYQFKDACGRSVRK